jgi:hypothetical protein
LGQNIGMELWNDLVGLEMFLAGFKFICEKLACGIFYFFTESYSHT